MRQKDPTLSMKIPSCKNAPSEPLITFVVTSFLIWQIGQLIHHLSKTQPQQRALPNLRRPTLDSLGYQKHLLGAQEAFPEVWGEIPELGVAEFVEKEASFV
jgi:hypothetical protein